MKNVSRIAIVALQIPLIAAMIAQQGFSRCFGCLLLGLVLALLGMITYRHFRPLHP